MASPSQPRNPLDRLVAILGEIAARLSAGHLKRRLSMNPTTNRATGSGDHVMSSWDDLLLSAKHRDELKASAISPEVAKDVAIGRSKRNSR